MLTLSYGFKKPQSGDKGNVFFPALEDNAQLLNDHDHDGSNSAPINAVYLTKSSATILAASWVDQGGGTWRQEVTLPSGFTLLSTNIRFEISGGGSDGALLYLSVEKGSAANKYYVYINDNSLALRALYS